MYVITSIEDPEHGYACEDPTGVFEVVLRITKSEKDADDAMNIAKLMDWGDHYCCFNKYFIDRKYQFNEKYKRILSPDELETMLHDAYEKGKKAGKREAECDMHEKGETE